MPSNPSWLQRGSRALAARLDRLRDTFDHLREQLRDAISTSISRTVAEAVREAVYYLLGQESSDRPMSSRHSYRTASNDSRMWDREQDPWAEPEERYDERHAYSDEPEPPPDTEPCTSRLSRSLQTGCEAAAWWLGQRWGRLPWLAASIIGGLAAIVSYIGGPLAVAGVALAGSVVSLFALTRASQIALGPRNTT